MDPRARTRSMRGSRGDRAEKAVAPPKGRAFGRPLPAARGR